MKFSRFTEKGPALEKLRKIMETLTEERARHKGSGHRPETIEFTSPKRFSYYSIEHGLLSSWYSLRGIGWLSRHLGKDFILEMSAPQQFHPVSHRQLSQKPPHVKSFKTVDARVYGVE
jgi:hypothetical protein